MSLLLDELVKFQDSAKTRGAATVNVPMCVLAVIISHIRTEESKLATLQKHLELTKGKSS